MPSSRSSVINLDYAASTPLRPEALAAQASYDASDLAGVNPNSLHSLGRRAAQELEGARRALARTLGPRVRPQEVILTGGGTESDQLGLIGIAEGVRERDRSRDRVIVSALEHDAILDNLPLLRAAGFKVDIVAPCREGHVTVEALQALLGPDVALVSIMLANNETGIIQPIAELSAAAHGVGAYFHTDAIQGYLHTPFTVDELGVDALSAAGHKVGGPVSSGFLYLKARTPLRPRIFGGGQEAGRRAGTQDVRSIIAFAAAATRAHELLGQDHERLMALSANLYERLLSSPHIQATVLEPATRRRLPGIVSVMVDNKDSEELILKLDQRGFAVSAGSACSSGSLDASHVLTAMGIPSQQAFGSLRISFDDRVDPAALEACAEALLAIVEGR